MTTTADAKSEGALGTMARGVQFNLSINTLDEMRAFCKILSATDLVPKAYINKPDAIMVAAMMGKEIGLPFFQSLQSIAVVNGNPSIYGDAALALVRTTALLEDFDEWIEVEGERQEKPFPVFTAVKDGKFIVAFTRSKRRGGQTRTTGYSVGDAVNAGLWEKKSKDGFPSPWCLTPLRMLMFRARGWNLRDQFGDVLKGLKFTEEVLDMLEMEARPDGSFTMANAPTPESAPKASTLGDLLKTKTAAQQAQTIVVPPQTPAPVSEPEPPAPAGGAPSPTETLPAQVEEGPSLDEQTEAQDLIAELNKTAKGRALLAGVRKSVKLLNPEEAFPKDLTRFYMFVAGLKTATEKVTP